MICTLYCVLGNIINYVLKSYLLVTCKNSTIFKVNLLTMKTVNLFNIFNFIIILHLGQMVHSFQQRKLTNTFGDTFLQYNKNANFGAFQTVYGKTVVNFELCKVCLAIKDNIHLRLHVTKLV